MIIRFNNFYYIFDAEGTLFFTDKLNTESYNFALMQNNLRPIENLRRITRKSIINAYPTIDKSLLDKIIQQKQEYFISNIEKINGNYFLLDILKKNGKKASILWTASNHEKIDYILKIFNITSYFKSIIFSNKEDIARDLTKICELLQCRHEQLLFFENDSLIAEKLKILHTNCLLLYTSSNNAFAPFTKFVKLSLLWKDHWRELSN